MFLLFFQAIWEELEHTEAIANSGSFQLHSDDLQCGSGQATIAQCRLFDIGVVEVSVHRNDPDPPRTLTSEMMPLAWYLKTVLQSGHGNSWAQDKCKEWYDIEKRCVNFLYI